MRVTAWVSTKKPGSDVEWTVEIPDDEFHENMTPAQRTNVIGDYVNDELANYFDWGWKEE